MTIIAGVLVLAAVVVAAIIVGVRQMRAVFTRANTRLNGLIADVLVEGDLERWESENGWAK